jgi:gamma-glutamyltranspeptidase/glutathione hydrolase
VWERPEAHRVHREEHRVRIEAHAPASWGPGLEERAEVEVVRPDPAGFGHAHLIDFRVGRPPRCASDARALIGAAVAV